MKKSKILLIGSIVVVAVVRSQYTDEVTSDKVEDQIAHVKPGTYQVGNELSVGEYVLISDSAYFEVCTSITCDTTTEVIYNDNITNKHYINLKANEFLSFDKGKLYTLEEYKLHKDVLVESSVTSGMYKVGVDIEVGDYVIESSQTSYLEICRHSSCTVSSIDYNVNFKNRAYFTISENEYVRFTEGTLIKESEYEHSLESSVTGSGYYEVGKDLEPGIYSITGHGLYEKCSSNACYVSESFYENGLLSGETVNVYLGIGLYLILGHDSLSATKL